MLRNKETGAGYVGQAVVLSHNLTNYGSRGRWLGHQSDARSPTGGRCTELNKAIRQYGADAFEVTDLHYCLMEDANFWEDFYMSEYNTMFEGGHGYNLRSAGNHGRLAKVTRQRMSEARSGEKHGMYNRPHRQESRRQISETLKAKTKRYDHYGNVISLPHLKYVKWATEEGYHIECHPLCNRKRFGGKPLDDQYEEAKLYHIKLDQELAEIESNTGKSYIPPHLNYTVLPGDHDGGSLPMYVKAMVTWDNQKGYIINGHPSLHGRPIWFVNPDKGIQELKDECELKVKELDLKPRKKSKAQTFLST